jgi:hypothetical protein
MIKKIILIAFALPLLAKAQCVHTLDNSFENDIIIWLNKHVIDASYNKTKVNLICSELANVSMIMTKNTCTRIIGKLTAWYKSNFCDNYKEMNKILISIKEAAKACFCRKRNKTNKSNKGIVQLLT